ncbi:hypothetical protein [Klebsiella pneumoniae]|uniref:hypothetical protein n=1 Tax=Klebsiella pneumoniae TaxID=573 RepID=UPI001D0E2BE9|nr:hypothetical protein [Klebsiella pneumoniae]
MTKSTITREQLEEWVAQFDEDGGCDATDRQLEALIRQSLAAMDSEPVAEVISNRPGNGTSIVDRALPVGTQLYRHAQTALVVPPEQHWEELCRQHPDMSIGDAVIRAAWWNHCRAAMLQAKSLTSINPAPAMGSLSKTGEVLHTNSPAQSDCCPAQNHVSPEQNSLTPAQDGNHLVIPDGYVMVPKEPTEAMMLHNSGCQHHAWDDSDCAMRQTRRLIWSHMLAAAPQKVK